DLPTSTGMLSTRPSQLSSLPLHVSGTQLGRPQPISPSSMRPLQSSSTPLHTSICGAPARSGTQAPLGSASSTQQVVCDGFIASHFLRPFFLQKPTPTLHAAPLSNPSSTIELQLSSLLLHTSTLTEAAAMSANAAWICTTLLAKRALVVPPDMAIELRTLI